MTAPMDMRLLEQNVGGDAAFRARLCDLLLAQAAKDLGLIRAAALAGNCGAVAGIAHRLRGAAGSMAAEPLQSVCATLEHVARQGNAEKVALNVSDLEAEIERLRVFLRR